MNLSTLPPCEIDEPNNSRQEATGLSVGDHTVQMRRFCAPMTSTPTRSEWRRGIRFK